MRARSACIWRAPSLRRPTPTRGVQRSLGPLAQIGQLPHGGVDVDRVLGSGFGGVLGNAHNGCRCYRGRGGSVTGPDRAQLLTRSCSTCDLGQFAVLWGTAGCYYCEHAVVATAASIQGEL